VYVQHTGQTIPISHRLYPLLREETRSAQRIPCMDPATAAGLALGVLPLIVSALENYDRIFQPLIIFTRSCRKEAEYFQLALRVQRTAFRNACRLLLYSATEYKLAVPDMLSGSQHQHLWRDGRFRERLEAQLGDSFEACVAALTLVKQTLDYLILRYDGVGLLLRDQVLSIQSMDPIFSSSIRTVSMLTHTFHQQRAKAREAF
jgi:hypothetical protein